MATVGMVFKKPWNGYVPGERAGFDDGPEGAANKLFDAGVARFIDEKRNVMNLGAATIAKLKQVFGSDSSGAPVVLPEPEGREVPSHELFNREPVGSPSGPSGPPPPSVTPTHVEGQGGTAWPPPAGADQDLPARPDELLGKGGVKKK